MRHRPVYLGTHGKELDTQAWLTMRMRGIGGSEAAAVAGASEWDSPMSVYLQKIGAVPATEPNEAMEWGNRLEPVVVTKFEEVTGRKVTNKQGLYRHPRNEFMLATIDGRYKDVDGKWCLYEGKTTNAWSAAEWCDDVPLHVWVQCQHNLCIMGFPRASVATLIGGQKFELVVVPRNDEYIQRLVEREREFYFRHMLTEDPPPVDGSRASEDALKMLYPVGDGTEIDPLPDEEKAEALIAEFIEWSAKAKAAQTDATKAENALKLMLGKSEAGTAGEWRVSWSSHVRRTLDSKAVTAAHPEIASQFMKETPYRKFAVKEMKDSE